jgi:hypothetical protein
MSEWNNITVLPPEDLLEVIDDKGNICKAYPRFHPYKTNSTIPYSQGHARIDAIDPYWDGSWIITTGTSREKMNFGRVVGWRQIEKEKSEQKI